jgi:hypothetical protein
MELLQMMWINLRYQGKLLSVLGINRRTAGSACASEQINQLLMISTLTERHFPLSPSLSLRVFLIIHPNHVEN